MNDDALSMFNRPEAAGEARNELRGAGGLEALRDRAVAVRSVELLRPGVRPAALEFEVRLKITEEEIMQYDGARDQCEQLRHVFVKLRIAEVIEHAIVVVGVVEQVVA